MCNGIDTGYGDGLEPVWFGWDPGQGDQTIYTHWLNKDQMIFTDEPLTGEELEALRQNPEAVFVFIKNSNFESVDYKL